MKHRILLIVALVSTAFIIAAVFPGCGKKEASSKNTGATDSLSAGGSEDIAQVDLVGVDSVSPFALLQQKHVVDFRKTALGVFVRGIDSIHAGPDAFWIYSVNDTMPQIAADRMLTRTGDKVIWHLRKAKR